MQLSRLTTFPPKVIPPLGPGYIVESWKILAASRALAEYDRQTINGDLQVVLAASGFFSKGQAEFF